MSIFDESFIDVIKYCPYAKENYTICTEFEPHRSCGSLICARKQAHYYSERCEYLENKLDIERITNERSKFNKILFNSGSSTIYSNGNRKEVTMNEITKLYENAGIEVPTVRLKIFKDDNGKIYTQPPFTAEKQISLMAFLINRKVGLSFNAEQGEITVEAISRGLAGIVNRIWQSLTEEEKKQVKEILE